MVWVAPKREAHSSFCGMTSTAMIFAAPASTPPCTQFSPMPPTPNTAMVAPDSTLARLITAPKPRHHTAADEGGAVEGHARVDRNGALLADQRPLGEHRGVGELKGGHAADQEGLRVLRARRVAAFGRTPTSQALQRPQCDRVDTITVSPSFTAVTPGPTASITPAPSWPRTTGVGYGMTPSMTLRSEWQRPAALSATTTSPVRGARSSTSSTVTGRSAERKTAAFTSSVLRVADAQDAAGACAAELAVFDDRLAVDHDARRRPRRAPASAPRRPACR